ncbi:MAG: ATP-grasp domain-containing protein [Thermodesulfobacteriota bacterium]
MNPHRKAIALERRLQGCANVLTIGVKTNFSDYAPEEAEWIRKAEKIYYPTLFYADLFNAMGKKTFPSYHTYKCVQDKIKQTALYQMLNIPHPRTRVFYGRRWEGKVLDYFSFPFVGKIPRGSALGRGVFLIRNRSELAAYKNITGLAYIQEYLPADRDIRVVVIGHRVVHAYWRKAAPGEFRSNIGAGGEVRLDPVPDAALDLALNTARSCGWDDVGIDICAFDGRFYVLEANMKYGKEGFRQAGIDYTRLMETLIENGEI